MADFLMTGVSGMLAFQTALATTGHNISNANTPGFSRQRAEMATRLPQQTGSGYIGSGVNVVGINRVYDQFTVDQLRTQTSLHSRLDSYYNLASQVDNLLADPDAGLAPTLQSFFNSLNGLADNPSSVPARQVVISEAGSLTERFHSIDSRLGALRDSVNSRIETLVGDVNALAESIAKANYDVVLSQGRAGNQSPNDLLDQRDELLRLLSEHIPVTAIQQDDGALNVFVGNGQALVIGTEARTIRAAQNPYDISRVEVAIGAEGSGPIISDYITGGEIGGALEFRNTVLEPALNALGRVAVGMTMTMNDQHRLGLTLDNNQGGDFFQLSGTSATAPLEGRPSIYNHGSASVEMVVDDPALLSTSDYRLDTKDGTNFLLTRLSDHMVIDSFSVPVPPGTYQSVSEGFTLNISGTASAGDSFQIEPTRAAARGLSLAVSNVKDIAAAGLLRTEAKVSNIGTATVTNPDVSEATNTNVVLGAGNVNLQYDPNAGGAGVPGFTVTGAIAGFLPYDPATQSRGAAYDLGIDLVPANANYEGISFTVSGTPTSGDQFDIMKNDSAVADNRNALSLAAVQTAAVLDDGSTNLQTAYGQMVSAIGAQTHQLEISAKAQKSILDQAVQSREAISGVNLDEEAANLVRFQQAYQATAQLISTSASLFQTLLDAVR